MNERPPAREVVRDAIYGTSTCSMRHAEQLRNAVLAALADAGYAVVPVEPTDAMVEAGCVGLWESECDELADEHGNPREHYKSWDQAKGAAREETERKTRAALTAALAAVGTEPREEN